MGKYSERGIPILPLADKVDALRTCLLDGSDEDAMGHLFDLIAHLAPGCEFHGFKGLLAIADHYAASPTPINTED